MDLVKNAFVQLKASLKITKVKKGRDPLELKDVTSVNIMYK